MGYDMSTEGLREAELPDEYKPREPEGDYFLKGEDGKAELDNEGYPKLNPDYKEGFDPGYFRLNIWGMGTMRMILARAGALDLEKSPGDFPRDDGSHYDEDTYEYHESDTRREYLAQRGEDNKIPAFKFGSNDGWWVTTEEAKATSERLEQWLKEQESVNNADLLDALGGIPADEDKEKAIESWRKITSEFATFNKIAALYGDGYRVY